MLREDEELQESDNDLYLMHGRECEEKQAIH